MARKVGAEVDSITKLNQVITVEDVKEKIARNNYDVLTMVQGETSCGVKNIHLEEIAKLAKENNILVIVDAVCTLSTMPLEMDNWGIDVVVTGGQKGLSSVPGVSIMAFSETAWDYIENERPEIPHWCLDAKMAKKFWQEKGYHYTAPVPGILALHEALRLICDETLEERHKRHTDSSLKLQSLVEAMGLELFTPKEFRLNSVVAIKVPDQINSKEMISKMQSDDHVEIAGAFGLNIIRIGQMGEQCRPENLRAVISAMMNALDKLSFPIESEKVLALLSD